MISINYDDGLLTVTQRQHLVFGLISVSWTKEEFQTLSGIDPSPFAKVIYEPEHPMYIVVTEEEPTKIHAYPDPNGHPALLWIHEHVDSLLAQAENKIAEQREYVKSDNTWIPRRQSLAIADLKAELTADVNRLGFMYLQTILTLSQIGEKAGLPITTRVNQRLQQVQTWVNARRDEIATLPTLANVQSYEIPVLDVQAEADIQAVMTLI